MTQFEYRGFTIQEDPEAYVKGSLMFYPTEEGIQHDGDVTASGNWKYCGNCHWSGPTVEEVKRDIDDYIYEHDVKDATIMIPDKIGPALVSNDEREYFFYTTEEDRRGFESFMAKLGFKFTGLYVSDAGKSVAFY